MTDYELNEIKTFIASPGDVWQERQDALAVIDEINDFLSDLGLPYRLREYAWEHDVHPDAGLGNQVVGKQIPVEKCQVLVAILWQRFGSRTGTKRSTDGRPYLSGTEEELDKAFSAREQSSSDCPIIMIYRKMMPISSVMNARDRTQFRLVNQFFEECKSSGKHPALYFEFNEGEFRHSLRRHLTQVVRKFIQQVPSPVGNRLTIVAAAKQTTVDAGSSETEAEMTTSHLSPVAQDPLMAWLRYVGLRENPFRHHRAEDENEYLGECFVNVYSLPIREFIVANKSWIAFAERGCGKTTLRTVAAAQCYPRDTRSDTLCIQYRLDELDSALLALRNADDCISLEHARHIIAYALDVIEQMPDKREQLSKNEYPAHRTWKDLRAFAQLRPSSRRRPRKSLTSLTARDWLTRLVQLTAACGFKHVLCLIDQTHEIHGMDDVDSHILPILRPLINASAPEGLGINFRYLLPTPLADIIHSQPADFRADRCTEIYLTWSDIGLRRMIGQRLRVFSVNQKMPRQSLAELCDSADNFAATIDIRLAEMAEGTPRAAIWLANELINRHCQSNDPLGPIRLETWQQVQIEWMSHGRGQIIGTQSDLLIVGDQVFFGSREVTLSKTHHHLLLFLIRSSGRVCTIDELARAGWPGENPGGVSKKAVDLAIQRLRKALEEQGIDPLLVETVRGRGYRFGTPRLSRRVMAKVVDKSDSSSQPGEVTTKQESTQIIPYPSTLQSTISPLPRDVLCDLMVNRLSLDDIEGVCFRLNVEYEELRGETKQAKIRSLVIHCEQRECVDKLITCLSILRKDISWHA